MKIGFLLASACTAFAVPATGQVRPQAGTGDPRLQSIDYRADQVVRIDGAVGYQIAIELAPDENVRSVALGDSGAWQVNADKAGNRLFLKPLVPGVATNMTVVTDVRTYAFDLATSAAADGTSPYTIRFRYPAVLTPGAPSDAASSPAGPMSGFYQVRGDRGLRPLAISDDGVRTFIEWPADAALPATYTRDAKGQETLANGYMRGPFYVVDSVEPHLVFRIDRRVARADRLPPEKR